MKRMHVHVTVGEIDQGVRFYSSLFGQAPSVLKSDYAKWVVEDPRVNFAISTHGTSTGFDHLGIQVDDEDELEEIEGRLRAAEADVVEQRGAVCCYAASEKSWTYDPNGVAWETFVTHGEAAEYGPDLRPVVADAAS